jgi:hypothetical protein
MEKTFFAHVTSSDGNCQRTMSCQVLIAAMLIATARFSAAASLRLADWRLEIDMSQPPITFWNATTDGCYKGDAIDETLTAFRTTGGQIRMVGGNGGLGPVSFVGNSLLTLKRDCATGPVINSRNNYSGPADFPHNMWLPATYAMEDGVTVHGLVHDEFHAVRESVPPEWCINTTVDNHTTCSGWASTVISVISTDGGKASDASRATRGPTALPSGRQFRTGPIGRTTPAFKECQLTAAWCAARRMASGTPCRPAHTSRNWASREASVCFAPPMSATLRRGSGGTAVLGPYQALSIRMSIQCHPLTWQNTRPRQ